VLRFKRCSEPRLYRDFTVGEDKAYDTSDHVAALREMNITPPAAGSLASAALCFSDKSLFTRAYL